MKLKLAFIFAVISALVFSFAGNAAAYETPARVRVGLESKFKEQAAIEIGNKTIMFGYELNGAFTPKGVAAASSGFRLEPADDWYAVSGETYESFERAASAAADVGTAAVPVCSADLWRVCFGGYGSKEEAELAARSMGGSVAEVNGRRLVLKDGDKTVALFDSMTEYKPYFPQFADAFGGDVKLADRKYRGLVEFGRYQGAGLTAVNVLSLDEYLYSAVPSEMPSKWHLEALKAQAVAARSYTLTRLGVHEDSGYELCDGVHCQVYLGSGNEADSTTLAVSETSGVAALYGGEPINAVYCSSSGGATENSENVWANAVPYLRSVQEVAETEAKQWVRAFELSEISALLSAKGIDIGEASSLSVSADPATGRVSRLTIAGANGSHTLQKGDIRAFFQASEGGMLESTNFTLLTGAQDLSGIYGDIPIVGVSGAGEADVVFLGRGWGHGVGMSQFGAKGMAEAGYTYDEILRHYYTGIDLQ